MLRCKGGVTAVVAAAPQGVVVSAGISLTCTVRPQATLLLVVAGSS